MTYSTGRLGWGTTKSMNGHKIKAPLVQHSVVDVEPTELIQVTYVPPS